MRAILVAVLFSLAGSYAAQAQRVLYSDYQPYDLRSGDFSVVGKAGGKLYTFRGGSDGFFLDAWSDSMTRLATVVLDFFPKRIYDCRFAVAGDKISVLYQGLDGRTVTQYAALLDGDGRLLKGPVKLDEARTSIFGASRSYFLVALSEDKRRVLVYNTDVDGRKLELKGILLDENLTVLRRPRAVFNASDDLAAGEAVVTNAGAIYLPAFTQTGGKDFADALWALRVPDSGTRFQATSLPLSGHYAGPPLVKADNVNGRLYVAGFYSDKRAGNYDGVLFSTLSTAENSLLTQKSTPFDDRLRTATGERSLRRAFNDFVVRQLVVKNDGGFVLAAEEYYLTTRTGYTPGWGYYSFYYSPFMMGGGPQVREYHYNDVLVLSYNADGTLEWPAFVRKEQYSQEDGGIFSSYALLNTGGSLGFLFNDFNRSRSTIQLATVDADGKIDGRSFSPGGAEEPDWLPRSAKQVASRELVVPCLRRKQLCFAKVLF